MRRLATALIFVTALAACNSSRPQANGAAAAAGTGGNAAAAPAPAAPASSPAPAPVVPAADAGLLAEFRAQTLSGCLEGAREVATEGMPVERYCGCAVDRVMAGRSYAQLAAEQGNGAFERRLSGEIEACMSSTGG